MSEYSIIIKRISIGMMLGLMLLLTACSSKKVDELRLQGIEELQKAKYEKAVETFNEAMELSDGKVGELQFDILMYRAEAEYMSGDLEAAEKSLKTLREVNGDKDEYIKFQAQLDAKRMVKEASEALDAGDTDTAKEKIDGAEALGIRNDRDLQYDKVVYYEKTAQWEEAYNEIKAYLNQYPDDEDAQREEKFLSTRVSALEKNEAMISG
ncbi:tetratricopeptide repeat protein [Oribacterium sp. P6A1]|uniref:tetratricopeptide repeat protein n=1 Tax=Oribacterium sp. P6A1 TaxID=1410612 RepID=UPI00068B9C36|nr:tetratricopeptide repeat protein [Oribacterium sp. P6A1]